MNDNDMVDIYVAVKDLKRSRSMSGTNLWRMFSSGIAMTPMVQMVQFDEKTATATFRIEGVCGEDLNGKNHAFHWRCSLGKDRMVGPEHRYQRFRH